MSEQTLPRGNYFIDLHLHIDGALSVDTVMALADMQGVKLPTYDREALFHLLSAPMECRDLNEYLERFDLPCSLMLTKETISEAVYRVQEELKAAGLIYAELRFAPQLHTGQGLTQEEVVLAAIEGLHRSDLRANLILCCMRGDRNDAANRETVRLAAKYHVQGTDGVASKRGVRDEALAKYRTKGVVAVDLAGAEGLYPTEDFMGLFLYAKALGLPYTIHAGEAAGANSVAAALQFGAKRIGHGVHSVQDAVVIKALREKEVPLELCITSNLQTKAEKNLAEYPLREFLKQGVKISLNTDNPTVSHTSMRKELELARKSFGLSNQEIKDILLNAAKYSFADQDTKVYLVREIEKAFEA